MLMSLLPAVEAPAPKTAAAATATKPETIAELKPEPKAESKAEIKANARKEIDKFFASNGPIPTLSFNFSKPEEWEYLKKENRRYAECEMTDVEFPEKIWRGVAVKLKGSAGSFRGPEDKPGLSVSMEKYKKGEPWRSIGKFHLNNGAQDNSYLNEQIAGEMARMAGVPASRCTHAFVSFHGKDFGIYVVKEGFEPDFLAHFFKKTDGDLYDGGFCHEIDTNMEKDHGDPADRAAIKQLMQACGEGDVKKRWEKLDQILDVDAFLSFMAMESILCHWDGYNFNRNNYRLYLNADSGKFVFFLHGMDQMFGDVNAPVIRDSGSMVGNAVFSNPLWKAAYRDRVEKIYTDVLTAVDWPSRVVEEGKKVQAALAAKNPQLGKDYQGQINSARDRVAQRIAMVGKQLAMAPKPPVFDAGGVMKLTKGWMGVDGGGGNSRTDEVQIDGKRTFHIIAENSSAMSWRTTIQLLPGKYRFEALAKCKGVIATNDAKGRGTDLRVSGNQTKAEQFLEGDSDWKPVSITFESSGGDAILVAELRAAKGEAWFQAESLQLVKLK